MGTKPPKVVATVPVGNGPDGVAVTPDGKHAYVANESSNNVSVIDTATNKVVKTVAVGPAPTGVAVTPDGKHAYVTNFGSNTVSVIATAINKVVATVPVGPSFIHGVTLNALIKPMGTLRYAFRAEATGASLNGTNNPVYVTLTIGDDSGAASVTAKISP